MNKGKVKEALAFMSKVGLRVFQKNINVSIQIKTLKE